MPLSIPSRYRTGLVAISQLNDPSFDELYAALGQISKSDVTTQKELVRVISAHVQSLSSDDVEKILDVLISLYQARGRLGIAPKQLASDVRDAVQREDSSLLENGKGETFSARLEKFLRSDSLNILPVKAKELQMDVERYFCDARILTDLRPVFGNEIDSPKGMIVIHTLKLAYHDSATGKHEEIFVAIDNGDIQKLKGILERAERKAKSLQSKLDAAGIKTVELS